VFPFDCGVQSVSAQFRTQGETHGFLPSTSRRSNRYDNVTAEAFCSTLKTEFVYRRHFATRRAAHAPSARGSASSMTDGAAILRSATSRRLRSKTQSPEHLRPPRLRFETNPRRGAELVRSGRRGRRGIVAQQLAGGNAHAAHTRCTPQDAAGGRRGGGAPARDLRPAQGPALSHQASPRPDLTAQWAIRRSASSSHSCAGSPPRGSATPAPDRAALARAIPSVAARARQCGG
jgi:hypothetical protein